MIKISEQNNLYLATIKLVKKFSTELNTTSYIWGGFTLDIYQGCFLREHKDLDYLTENLHLLIPQFIELFEADGWQTEELGNGDLRVNKNRIKIHLGHIQFTDEVKWTHNGERGHICFPISWLNPEPVQFYDAQPHVVKPEFEYVVKKYPQILNPEWEPRDKDITAREKLEEILSKRQVNLDTLYLQIIGWRMESK